MLLLNKHSIRGLSFIVFHRRKIIFLDNTGDKNEYFKIIISFRIIDKLFFHQTAIYSTNVPTFQAFGQRTN